MGFPDTWRTQQDHILAALHKRQTGQLPDNLTIDARLEGEVELLQRLTTADAPASVGTPCRADVCRSTPVAAPCTGTPGSSALF